MTRFHKRGRRRRVPRPAPNQPGTLRQQLDAVRRYLDLPEYFRDRDPDGAKAIAYWHALPHIKEREEEQRRIGRAEMPVVDGQDVAGRP